MPPGLREGRRLVRQGPVRLRRRSPSGLPAEGAGLARWPAWVNAARSSCSARPARSARRRSTSSPAHPTASGSPALAAGGRNLGAARRAGGAAARRRTSASSQETAADELRERLGRAVARGRARAHGPRRSGRHRRAGRAGLRHRAQRRRRRAGPAGDASPRWRPARTVGAGEQGVTDRRRPARHAAGRARASSSPSTPSTRRWPSACAPARRRRGAPAAGHRQRRPVPRPHAASELADVTPAAGAGPPDLGHGPADHHQLGDARQQGPRGHRGAPAVRRPVRPHRRRRPPAVGRPLDGRVRRRLDDRPGVAAGHAAADRARAGLAGPGARRGARTSTGRTAQHLDVRAAGRRRVPGRRAGPRGRARRAAAPRPSSTPPTRSWSPPSTTGGSASCRSWTPSARSSRSG